MTYAIDMDTDAPVYSENGLCLSGILEEICNAYPDYGTESCNVTSMYVTQDEDGFDAIAVEMRNDRTLYLTASPWHRHGLFYYDAHSMQTLVKFGGSFKQVEDAISRVVADVREYSMLPPKNRAAEQSEITLDLGGIAHDIWREYAKRGRVGKPIVDVWRELTDDESQIIVAKLINSRYVFMTVSPDSSACLTYENAAWWPTVADFRGRVYSDVISGIVDDLLQAASVPSIFVEEHN
ncbi:hypothetical protein [Bifidobacterium magnum]|uniref:Uncharacterized protein n=1 Tax=Bifidobacterium magnum TaxID=1692 RepID=A0A087B672_9BIFI|nr:hypothetical protein [Bifidobacterium magnum]KFI66522.1 hypothetical protein BMAGN_1430 [Bifidobacterium magnum]